MQKDRDEQIRKMRKGGMTLQEIADIYKVTRERVRQICDKGYNLRRRKLSTSGK